jgi:hypothetical protein
MRDFLQIAVKPTSRIFVHVVGKPTQKYIYTVDKPTRRISVHVGKPTRISVHLYMLVNLYICTCL